MDDKQLVIATFLLCIKKTKTKKHQNALLQKN